MIECDDDSSRIKVADWWEKRRRIDGEVGKDAANVVKKGSRLVLKVFKRLTDVKRRSNFRGRRN